MAEEETEMRERERKLLLKRLDVEMRPFRRAGREKKPTQALLRAVRTALRVPMAELTRKLDVHRSVVFELEESEKRQTITLRSMARMAAAMGCTVVYGVVPLEGKTLEELAEKRLWARVFGLLQPGDECEAVDGEEESDSADDAAERDCTDGEAEDEQEAGLPGGAETGEKFVAGN